MEVIPDALFLHCKNLTEIVIPDKVTKICSNAFKGCERLTSINIPDGITTIYSGAFGQTAISQIVIPISVIQMDAHVFSNYWHCNITIYCEASSKPDGWDENWSNGNDSRVIWGYTNTQENN